MLANWHLIETQHSKNAKGLIVPHNPNVHTHYNLGEKVNSCVYLHEDLL